MSNTFIDAEYSTDVSILNSEIKNKGFIILDHIFKANGWNMNRNDINWITYVKDGQETDFFDIKVQPTNIRISIPVRNSPFQFVTFFNDYFSASEYVEARFFDFIKKN